MSPIYVRSLSQIVGILTAAVTQVAVTALRGRREPLS